MELTSNRTECTVRLLQNGKYTWTITVNEPIGQPEITANTLKKMDSALQNVFPNHVRENSIKIHEMEE